MDVFAAIHYRKCQQIGVGQGLNSEVFLAADTHLGRTIAVKEIDRARIKGGGWNDYHREAKAMFAARHSSIVPVHYACLTASHVCLAMPYFSNGSLQDRIATGPVPLGIAYRIAQEALTGAAHIHAASFLHFDLKPSNILFSDTGEALISDFGQARLIGPAGTAPVPPLYRYGIPPEALATGAGLVESDVYQLGLTFYRTFNGDPFFKDQIPRLRLPLKEAVSRGRLPNRRRGFSRTYRLGSEGLSVARSEWILLNGITPRRSSRTPCHEWRLGLTGTRNSCLLGRLGGWLIAVTHPLM